MRPAFVRGVVLLFVLACSAGSASAAPITYRFTFGEGAHSVTGQMTVSPLGEILEGGANAAITSLDIISIPDHMSTVMGLAGFSESSLESLSSPGSRPNNFNYATITDGLLVSGMYGRMVDCELHCLSFRLLFGSTGGSASLYAAYATPFAIIDDDVATGPLSLQQVPEPALLLLFAVGIGAFVLRRKAWLSS